MSLARLMQQAAAGAGPEPSGWTDPDLGNASYDSVSFSVAGQETGPRGMFFKPDGSKLYVVGSTGDDVNEYDLSTAWDVSTASYVQNFSVSAQSDFPTGVLFKPDGTNMYVVGSGKVFEYAISTAWDISTASYSDNFSFLTQEGSPQGVYFKTDGTKLYMVGNSDSVYEYNLSTSWDVSSSSYVQSFSVSSQETGPTGIFINPDGQKLFVVGFANDSVYQYSLSTAWDISSASYDNVSFDVSAQLSTPQDFFFKDDGSKMYVVGTSNDTIYQYSTA